MGITIHEMILIDTKGIKNAYPCDDYGEPSKIDSFDWIVAFVAHELQHAQLGFWENQKRVDKEYHDRIRRKSELIRLSYLKWLDSQN